MKKTPPEKFRLTAISNALLNLPRYLETDDTFGMTGMFHILHEGVTLRVISSENMGWEHVSVSLTNRCPTWAEMCFVKSLFWEDEEAVVQFHPKKKDYVNYHPHCLHMWKRSGLDWDTPPKILVGPS